MFWSFFGNLVAGLFFMVAGRMLWNSARNAYPFRVWTAIICLVLSTFIALPLMFWFLIRAVLAVV